MILRLTIFAAALTLITGEIRAQPTGTYKTSDEDLRKALTDEITVNANTQAEDGRAVRAWIGFNGETAQTLPPLAEMEKTLHTFAADITATSKAPIADHGNAVVIFEGIAAARILHRLLAEQISGTPLPSTLSSTIGANVNALADRIGQPVGPKFLHAYDDPSLERGPGNVFLFGSYRTDDEGVPG